MFGWPNCCCVSGVTPCTALIGHDLLLTCPSGTHTLHHFSSPPNDAWSCCFSFTDPNTRNNVFAGCPSVASGLAYIEYRLGNCPPYGTSEDSSRGLLFAIATGLSPCEASSTGYVYSRTSSCSGNFLTSPTYGFNFGDEDYAPEYPFGITAIPIDFTSAPFSMTFTLPEFDINGYPTPFFGDFVITLL